MSNLRIIIIGASSSIAEHCARLWVQQPVDLYLVGRDLIHLEQIACDLRVRNPQAVIHSQQANFLDPVSIQATVDELMSQKTVDIILIAHGYLPEQKQCETNLVECQQALIVNALSPVLFAEAFAQHLAKQNHGCLALIGSVAGDRGRKSNYVYGAAKGLVARYAQGLQHRFAKTAVKITLIKPGPTDTPMTAQLKQLGMKLAPVELVAQQIVQGIAQGKSTVYTPRKWRLIMGVIQHLPLFIFKRLNI